MKWTALLIGFLLAGLAGWLLRPVPPAPPVPVPTIVTVHDTVHTPPDTTWLRGPTVHDTIHAPNLVIRETLHDTVTVNVGSDTAQREVRWPILALTVGAHRGDTTRIATLSLRSGKTMTSTVWTPGPLAGAWWDASGTPQLTFYQPTVCTVGLGPKVRYGLIGAGVAAAVIEVGRAVLGR